MSIAREDFFSRWSRLKRKGGEAPAAAVAKAPPAPLPELDQLGFNDDFSGFLRQEVEERVKRLALKKLFHSSQFNVMDGLDVYIDDYTIPDPIDAATLRTLHQARGLLFDTPNGDIAVAGAADHAPPPVATDDGDIAGSVADEAVTQNPAAADLEGSHHAV